MRTHAIAAAALIGLLACTTGAESRFPDPAVDPAPAKAGTQTAVFAGGCFWGVEAVFEKLNGVSDSVSGYAGGKKTTANYELVGTGTTGHAESVQVTYDPAVISYGKLLKVFFAVAHDPTQLNRQGPDEGRSTARRSSTPRPSSRRWPRPTSGSSTPRRSSSDRS